MGIAARQRLVGQHIVKSVTMLPYYRPLAKRDNGFWVIAGIHRVGIPSLLLAKHLFLGRILHTGNPMATPVVLAVKIITRLCMFVA